ncbi:ATP-dependent RecD-like DNA helicase [Clostridium sp. KNHs216]|uniref:ATP-dependent DNA helicase n=1 Tax=Clostridium sp. KNHs216 TaxID=1550235 RepID=UPI0011502AB5|nr:ATP-dependent RecD-like DNA helicase [Clostridium sp. KNHs216]TQI67885.1 UvrD-like helicase family protein [Clostridium sp. KNHs216]
MLDYAREIIERHIRTHTERSDEDRAAVSILQTFLRSSGKINTNFSCDDKWPNADGTFEFVSEPNVSRRPKQNFFVQIKGTHVYSAVDGMIKYSLKSLAFPAFIYSDVTFDPGILFVVLNPDCRGSERVFWKYMSVDFLNSIDFENSSVTISFSSDEEIFNTDESVNVFCNKLEDLVDHHSFVNQLDSKNYSKNDVEKIIRACDEDITESIDRLDILNDTRDGVSRRILTRLSDLCTATLLLNTLGNGNERASLQLAWEHSILSIETKYLGTFLKGLQYIGKRIPDDGQSERLLLKYYNFLWQIRKFLQKNCGMSVLHNLEKFPLHIDELDRQYYQLAANAVDSVDPTLHALCTSRFYVQKKVPFFIGTERYFEVTLQLASIYATKYNRITAYTKENISTNYSIQIGYVDTIIDLWGIASKIKVITNWKVSIEPACLNKLGKILRISTNLSSKYGEYNELMTFLTRTGINFLDLIDLQTVTFSSLIDPIYEKTNTCIYKEVLLKLKAHYSKTSEEFGRNVIRYLLLNLREEALESVMPSQYKPKQLCAELYLSSRCLPFERNPFISDLAGSKTSGSSQAKHILSVVGSDKLDVVRPYLFIKNSTKQTGEIYFEIDAVASKTVIDKYNAQLDSWEHSQGYQINLVDGLACIDSYEKTTLLILKQLLEFSKNGNKGQEEYNQNFLKQSKIDFTDRIKEQAIRDVFVDSQLLLIYGAAGTGKTTLINYISNLMTSHRKLFLTKTHTALQNLKRRIDNPGTSADFVSIDSFTKKVVLPEYDIIFVDECSTIDNRTMLAFLNKLSLNTFLVFAGDIQQIESIEFGNWFFYAKDIIKAYGANIELLNTWRTKNQTLIGLWNEVRLMDELITEKLVIDGPFSEDIGPKVFKREEDDEVILCLNYDGKFGLNNMNNYFQNANSKGEAVSWQEWNYKVGDPILFNDTKRFSLLYNNLKGRIVKIEKENDRISFTIDVDISLTDMDCRREGVEFIDVVGNSTRIRFSVYAYDGSKMDMEDDDLRMKSIIPFQLAYAVSIHKAQGLEYDSVKVIIPNNNAEKITHGVFYTAITRAKKKLKIYWSSETMQEVIKGFSANASKCKSLEIVKSKLVRS